MAVVAAHVEMMNRIKAEEALAMCRVTAVGSGQMKRAAAQSALTGLERAARGRRRGPGAKATPGQIQAIGIGFQVVERPTAAERSIE